MTVYAAFKSFAHGEMFLPKVGKYYMLGNFGGTLSILPGSHLIIDGSLLSHALIVSPGSTIEILGDIEIDATIRGNTQTCVYFKGENRNNYRLFYPDHRNIIQAKDFIHDPNLPFCKDDSTERTLYTVLKEDIIFQDIPSDAIHAGITTDAVSLTSSPPYLFNPKRHVKIWLSANNQSFLSQHNQLQLVRMRTTNPTDTISFVYDSRLLLPTSIVDLKAFCYRHNIEPIDAADWVEQDSDILNRILFELYNKEINNFKSCANLVTASDLLRWTFPGVLYSDFDVDVNTQHLLPTINVNVPLLVNLSVTNSNIEFLSNDLIVVLDENHCVVREIKRTMILRSMSWSAESCESNDYVRCISTLSYGKSGVAVKEDILSMTASNKVMLEFVFRNKYLGVPPPSRPLLRNLFLIEFRTAYRKGLTEPELSDRRLQMRQDLIRECVIYTTGPGVIYAVLNSAALNLRSSIQLSGNNFFRYYPALISKLPVSTSTIAFRKTLLRYSLSSYVKISSQAGLFYLPQDDTSEAFWLEDGINASKQREFKIKRSARKIIGFFEKMVRQQKATDQQVELIECKQAELNI